MSDLLGGVADGFNATGALDPFERNSIRQHEQKLLDRQEAIEVKKQTAGRIEKQIQETQTSMKAFIDLGRELKMQGASSEQLKGIRRQIITLGASAGYVDEAAIEELKASGNTELAEFAAAQLKQSQLLAQSNPMAANLKQQAQLITNTALGQFDAIINASASPQQLAENTAEAEVIKEEALEDAGLNKTTTQRELEAAGLEAGTPEYRQALRQSVMPSDNSVKIINKAESALQVERAKNIASREGAIIQDVDEAASAAFRANDKLAFLEKSTEQLKTGSLLPLKKSLGGLVEAMGLDPSLIGFNIDELASAQAFSAAVSEIALIRAENMKGNLSDKDLAFLTSSAPQLSNTVEGNKLIIDYMQRMNEREINKQVLMDSYLEENSGSLEGFSSAWRKHIKDNPLFADQEQLVKQASIGTPVSDKFETMINSSGDEELLPVYELVNGKLKRVQQ